MLKTFYYQFIDPTFIKSIQVNIKECSTVEELTKKIASFFNLSYYRLIVENQPKEKFLEKITEKFVFILKLPNRRADITFFFLKSKMVTIKNGYKLNYNEIICSFQKNQLYYSDNCIQNHIHFMIFDKELPHIEYPLLAIPSGICVNVKVGCETVNINYDVNNFIFAENERASEAIKLIKKAYEGCDSVTIQANEKKINVTDSLKRTISYEVSVYYKVTFKNIENFDETLLYLDFLSTVSDSQKQLLYKLVKYEEFNQFKIILYNGNMQIINDYNQMLKNIQDFNHFFYYQIKEKSPEKAESKKPNIKLDSNILLTPNKQRKIQNIDYSLTPEPTTKLIFEYELGQNSKTPDKNTKTFKFNSDLNSIDDQQENSMRKKKTNVNQKQSSKSKASKDDLNFNQKSTGITEFDEQTDEYSSPNLQQKEKEKEKSDDFYQSPVLTNLMNEEEEEEEFLERNENDNSNINMAIDDENNNSIYEEDDADEK